MNSSNRLKLLMDSGKTVFTPQDLRTLWGDGELNAKTNAVRMVAKGLILRIAKGYYALSEQYNIYELANRMVGRARLLYIRKYLFWGVLREALTRSA